MRVSDLSKLSVEDLKKVKRDKPKKLKKEFEFYEKKRIDDIIKIENTRKKLKKNKPANIRNKRKHLMSILQNVSKINQFLKIRHHT